MFSVGIEMETFIKFFEASLSGLKIFFKPKCFCNMSEWDEGGKRQVRLLVALLYISSNIQVALDVLMCWCAFKTMFVMYYILEFAGPW